MMNVTRLGMLLAVSVCAIPVGAMKPVDPANADEATWKVAWSRGIQNLPPAVTPFPLVEAPVPLGCLNVPAEGVDTSTHLSAPLYAETPFVGLEGPASHQLLTGR